MKIKNAFLIVGIFLSTSGFAQTTLKAAFKNDFRIGAAINEMYASGQNPNAVAIIQTQFDTISPEICLKWQPIHPGPERYNLGPADQYVEFGQKNGMFIIGHNLI